MNKNGDMTFQQIIIAVISLIVLVVLVMIFTGKISIINEQLESCANKQGTCESERCPAGEIQQYGNYNDCAEGEVCCVSPFIDKEEDTNDR
jgi:uncharacterized membrane protein